MLTDERFSSKAKVDRYGRKLRGHVDGKDKRTNVELTKLYRVEVEEKDVPDSDAVVQAELSRVAKKYGDTGYDPARDGGYSESSSSEGESESEEVDDQSVESDSAEDGVEDVPEGEVSKRLAVVNLDWDHVRAVDLLAAFSSYASTGIAGNKVEKVTIYPSEFGKERMEREEVEGPPKELFARKKVSTKFKVENAVSTDEETNDEDADEDEDERIRRSLLKEDNGEEVSSTKLRNYQLERLRYFYAVVTCSDPSVAKEIYDNVDGREYLSSANFFDLRFIPDEMDFQEDKPRDECSRIPSSYRPNEFVTAALQHSKVKLTWDAEDAQRKEIQQRAFSGSRKDLDENELRAYLASDHSSSEDEQDVDIVDSTIDTTLGPGNNSGPSRGLSKSESKRQLLRAKLGLSDESKVGETNHTPVGGMQVTFTPGLSAAEKQASVFENEPEIEETTAEKYIRKERERKARRKEKLKVQRSDTTQTHADSASAEGPGELQQDNDRGFDDLFFTATPAEAEVQAKQKKKLKQRQYAAEQKAAATTAATNDIAELEGILQSSTNNNNNRDNITSHFSLSALEKAERALKKQKLKRGKGRRLLSQSEKAALEAKAKDTFEMDVADERFAAVYERPEFALDPSHPRFRETEGMQNLLQEARQRRKRKLEEDV